MKKVVNPHQIQLNKESFLHKLMTAEDHKRKEERIPPHPIEDGEECAILDEKVLSYEEIKAIAKGES